MPNPSPIPAPTPATTDRPTGRPRRSAGALSVAMAFALGWTATGCRSAGPAAGESGPASATAPEEPASRPEDPARALAKGSSNLAREPIGYFLSEMDGTVRAWSNLKLGARTGDDFRKIRILEQNLAWLSRERAADLVAELEAGPPQNRAVAAILLGFAGGPQVQSPLLAALADREAEVVNNALIGLGLLGRADTPTSQLCYLLRNHPDGATRNNAAYALKRTTEAAGGAPSGADEVLSCCRLALADPEGGVRTQAASVLGRMADGESIAMLGDLLFDGTNLVALAAARALREIGAKNPEHKGSAARALVSGFERGQAERRDGFRRELALLAAADYGSEPGPWREWAYKMP